MTPLAALVSLWLVAGSPPQPTSPPPFDWDRYHDRQDACREKDRLLMLCTAGPGQCDQEAINQATRRCHAWRNR